MFKRIDQYKELLHFLSEFNPDSSKPLLRCSLVLLIISGLFVFLVSVLTIRHQKDFSQDYFAAQAFIEGSSIYSQKVLDLGNQFNGRGVINAHPPSIILIFIPFTALSYTSAFLLFTLFQVLVYLKSIDLAAGCLGCCKFYRRLLIVASLLWPATLQGIHQGSISFLIAAFMILGWVFLNQERRLLASGVLGFATGLKFFPAVLIAPFILRRDLKACMVYSLSFCALILISFYIFGWKEWSQYIFNVAPKVSENFSTHYANVSIWGLILPWFENQPYLPTLYLNPSLGRGLAYGLAIILVGLAIFNQINRSKVDNKIDYSYWLWALCSVLLSPVSWQYSLVFLVIPLSQMIKASVEKKSVTSFNLTLFIGVFLVLSDYDRYSLVLKNLVPLELISSISLYMTYIIYTKLQALSVLIMYIVMAT